SVKKNDLEQLIKKIKEIFEIQEFIYSDMNALQSNRQINILKQVVQFLKIALEQIKIIPIDLVIENYNNALEGINKILGLDKEYDFLNELFANFCLGK
ncbi:tRNA uridine-5-carboxymethylaminomethyl(34) synthesis GTPase MnmE, partial [bacterium]|nr:tRNA uridine-5-carboxymethylaminomethyl(34) synthesis GTPase MnmE [bacterium]